MKRMHYLIKLRAAMKVGVRVKCYLMGKGTVREIGDRLPDLRLVEFDNLSQPQWMAFYDLVLVKGLTNRKKR